MLTYALRGLIDDGVIELVESLNREHYGITFVFDEYYKTEGDTSFGGDATYRHAWNDAGRFRLQVSLRERPIADANSGWNEPLVDMLRAEIRDRASG